MGEEDEVADLASRARKQMRHAAKNTGRAAQAAAKPVLEEAQEGVDRLEEVAEDAVETAKRLNFRVMSRISGDTGQAFLALSVAIFAATVATSKFKGAFAKSGSVLGKPPGDSGT